MLLCTLAITVTLIGCNSMPQAEFDAAQNALQAADSADADIYVTDLYQAATDSFAIAQQAIEGEAYDEATRLLEVTTTIATEAQQQVAARKEAMRISNESLIVQAEQAVAQASLLMSQPSATPTIEPVSFQNGANQASADLEGDCYSKGA